MTNLNSPGFLALDEDNIYWTGNKGATIVRVSKRGGHPTTLACGQKAYWKPAVDFANVYWTNDGPGAPVLMRVPIIGGSPVILARYPEAGGGVALDMSTVFFSTSESLSRVEK
jgi:hypothetical protein